MVDYKFRLILLLLIEISRCGADECIKGKQIQGTFGDFESFQVEFEEQLEIVYTMSEEVHEFYTDYIQNSTDFDKYSSLLVSPISWRVFLNVSGVSPEGPVSIILKDGKTEKSLNLPYSQIIGKNKEEVTYQSFSRVIELCPYKALTAGSILKVLIYSSSLEPINVEITVSISAPWVNDNELSEEKIYESEHSLSVISPVIKKSFFSLLEAKNDESILITVDSEPNSNCLCSVISIQQPNCPYFDTISSATR